MTFIVGPATMQLSLLRVEFKTSERRMVHDEGLDPRYGSYVAEKFLIFHFSGNNEILYSMNRHPHTFLGQLKAIMLLRYTQAQLEVALEADEHGSDLSDAFGLDRLLIEMAGTSRDFIIDAKELVTPRRTFTQYVWSNAA